MPSNSDLKDFPPPELFSHQTLELTFRLLRYNQPALADAVRRALDEVAYAPPEALYAVTDIMHLKNDLLKCLKPTDVIKIVGTLNDIARSALEQKDLPAHHMKILSNLIEDWAELTEWILQHTTSDLIARL